MVQYMLRNFLNYIHASDCLWRREDLGIATIYVCYYMYVSCFAAAIRLESLDIVRCKLINQQVEC